MRKLTMISVAVAFLLPQAAAAWNNAGHEAAAAVAYLSLSAEVKERVDELLQQHPDFSTLSRGLMEEAPDFGLVVFMRAAIWPDLIRGDRRFFDDTNEDAEPTPLLPGFPDMKIHKPWHFIDLPFSTDGTPTAAPDTPNALTQIVEFRSSLGSSDVAENIQAYNLSWLLHLVGDIHQPLHGAARFSALHQDGDRGGNSFRIGSSERNLHTFWDRSFGVDDDPQEVAELARGLLRDFKRDATEVDIASDGAAESTVLGWVGESATLARYVVYTIGTETARPPHPSPSNSYRSLSREIARHRVAIAGHRLAAMISDRLE
jgi:hypothetical protein